MSTDHCRFSGVALRCLLALGAFASVSALAVDEARAASIRVPASAEVRTAVVHLGDVAVFSGLKGPLRARLAGIDLGPAPIVGEGRLIPKAYLVAALGDADVPAEVAVRLPERLELTRAVKRLSGAELAHEVETRFRAQVPEGTEIAAVKVPALPDLTVPADAEIEIAVAQGADYTQPVTAAVTIRDGERIVRAQKVVLHVDAMATAYVLTSPVGRGQALGGDVVEARRMASSEIPSDAIRRLEELDGATTRRELKAGEPVTRRVVELASLVKRGDRVTMVARQGSLRISAVGEALGQGRRGESVKIRNIDSQKVVSGRVIGPQEVEMEL